MAKHVSKLFAWHYRFATKSIAYGFTTGYVYADRYEDWGKFYTTEREYFSDVNSFFFAPTFKWAYYNKPTLQMYLGAQIGMKLDKAITRIDNRYLSNEKIIHRTSTYLYGQFTAFGISYGRDFYIGAELGFGHKGMITLTAGYRF